MSRLIVAVLLSGISASTAAAERITFDLSGLPSGSLAAGESFDLAVALDARFSRIDAVELVVSGQQQLGSGYDLNDPPPFTISARMSASIGDGGDAASIRGAVTLPDAIDLNEVMMPIDRSVGAPSTPPDYGVLADGEATLRFTSEPLLFIGTTVVDRLPSFTVTAVTLVVEGALVPEPGGALAALAGSVMLVVARRR